MNPYPKIKVMWSACLGFSPCRYDGSKLSHPWPALGLWGDLWPFCPEMDAQMGCPRLPVNLVQNGESWELRQVQSETNWSQPILAAADLLIGHLEGVQAILLKSKSPSCALTDAKRYPKGPSGAFELGPGLVAEHLCQANLPVILADENRLADPWGRQTWAAGVFQLARLQSHLGPLENFHKEQRNMLIGLGAEKTCRNALIEDLYPYYFAKAFEQAPGPNQFAQNLGLPLSPLSQMDLYANPLLGPYPLELDAPPIA